MVLGYGASVSAILDLIDFPAMLLRGRIVTFANPAAQAMLGGHIVGQDVRIGLRHPAAIALLAGDRDGAVLLEGVLATGSRWELARNRLDDGSHLVTLQNRSSEASVARAHADFVANASHELRTPLSAILGYVETLRDAEAGADAQTRERFLGIIAREATRMQALVEDLMSLSRIEAEKHSVPSAEVDLVQLAQRIAAESGAGANILIEANQPRIIVAGDSGQLSQLLRNLVDNAIKYGGKHDGANRRVHVALEQAQTSWVKLSVRDEGEGIAAEHLPRLTERFYRVDAGRSRASGGTGLGLAIVKHIVERHRGRLDIASRIGEGTIVTLMLPTGLATGLASA